MNAMPVSPTDLIEESDHVNGSDSDSNLGDDDDAPEYYEPISAEADDEETDRTSDGEPHSLPNGYFVAREAANGMSSLRLSDNKSGSEDSENDEDDDDEAEAEAITREEADSAAARAFREDEARRNAPLAAETSVRVIEAMRGVSFGGVAPDWAVQVPESDWIDHLQRLRQPPPPS